MSITHSTIRNGKLLAASAALLAMLTTGASAYTAQEQQLCTGDAMRLCGEFIPNVARITACMTEKYQQLSDGCKSVFEAPPATPAPTASTYSPPGKTSKPLAITPHLKRS